MDINKISFTIQGSATSASKAIDELIIKLSSLNKAFDKMANSTKGALGGLGVTSEKTAKSMSKVRTSTHHTSSAMGNLIKRITQITFLLYVARRAFGAFGDGIQTSIAYVENLNLFMVALGENTTRATSFIKEMANSLYLDEAQLTRVQGLFYQISDALGLGAEKAYILSENFTKLAYDLASFYNITIENAVTKLQAGLVGETEPLRRIGIIITENNLAETARTLGIKKSIRNMTEQEKIQLRYITALEQTRNAQGDLARTLKQPENLLRIMREQFRVLMRELGNIAIPVIQRLVPQVIGLTLALNDMARALALSLGYEAPEISDDLGGHMNRVAETVEEVEKGTSAVATNLARVLKYTKATNTAMSGIDELNVLSDTTTTSGGSNWFSVKDLDKSTSLIDLALENYNNRMSESANIFNDIKDKWVGFFLTLKDIFKETREAISNLKLTLFGEPKEKSDDFMGGTLTFFETMNVVSAGIIIGLTRITQKVKDLYEKYLEPIFMLVAPDWYDDLLSKNEANVIGAIAKIVELLGSLALLSGLTGIFRLGAKFFSSLPTVVKTAGLATLVFELMDIAVNADELDIQKRIDEQIFALLLGVVGFGLTGSLTVGSLTYGLTVNLNVYDWLFTGEDSLGQKFQKWAEGFPTPLKILLGIPLNTPHKIDLSVDAVSGAHYTPNNPSEENSLVGLFPQLDKIINLLTLLVYINTPKSDSTIESIIGDRDIFGTTLGKSWNEFLMNRVDTWFDIFTGKQDFKLFDFFGTFNLNNVDNKDNSKDGWFTNWFKGLFNKDTKGTSRGAGAELEGVLGFANGGTPQKGSLFIAGEAGAELVGDLGNGGTSVLNKKQIKKLGIPMYANGVNVPKWTPPEQLNSKIYAEDKTKSGKTSEDHTKTLNKAFSFIPNLIKLFKAFITIEPSDWVTTAVDGIKKGVGAVGGVGKGAVDVWKTIEHDSAIFWEGLKDTNMIKGVVKTFKNLKDTFESGEGILGKTFKAFSLVGKGATAFIGESFNLFKGDKGIQQVMSETPSDGTTLQQQGIAGDVLTGLMGDGTAKMIFGLMQGLSDGTVGAFISSLPTFVQAGVDMLKGMIDGILKALPVLVQELPKIIQSIVDIFTNKESLNAIISGLLQMMIMIVQALPSIIMAIVDAIPTIIMTLIEVFIDNLPLFFKLGLSIAVAIIEGLAKIIATGIDIIISPIRGLLKFFGVKIPKLASKVDFSWMMPTFADGGYPTQGQMFIAREAGAELVGNVGGRTAVMNNDQIVQAVSEGVYRAVSQALGEQGDKEMTVYLDGKKVSQVLGQTNKNMGLAFGTGGY